MSVVLGRGQRCSRATPREARRARTRLKRRWRRRGPPSARSAAAAEPRWCKCSFFKSTCLCYEPRLGTRGDTPSPAAAAAGSCTAAAAPRREPGDTGRDGAPATPAPPATGSEGAASASASSVPACCTEGEVCRCGEAGLDSARRSRPRYPHPGAPGYASPPAMYIAGMHILLPWQALQEPHLLTCA